MNKRKKARREDNKLLKEWSKKVKARDDMRCVMCGETKMLNAHHIIPRDNKKFRYDIDNGISLCPLHHQFSRICSAHGNSYVFVLWFIDYRPEQHQRLMSKFSSPQELFGLEGSR